MHIHWFPGHMTKAKRMIESQLRLVDVVIELLDARIPLSSSNPLIPTITKDKPRVIALNKSDMADRSFTDDWIHYYKDKGIHVVAIDSMTGKGTKQLVSQVEISVADKIARLKAKGIQNRSVRAMILGIPNVGKSSLINRLLGSATVKTGDKAGVTRGQQWIKIGKNLELLDTPGVLWPKQNDQEVAFKLAVTGAMNDEVFDMEEVALKLLETLSFDYPVNLIERYKLSEPLPSVSQELLELIGRKRGCIRSGGVIDTEKVIRMIITEFRTGKLGSISLDRVPC
ncbi:ribosome biogenesis GTPase A [Sporomusaceae bacterium BoRhaA]|uniref:ribosome biogenesis GTPase YlqF n=1 Tax=Pelorhabdus rhamnosifermentans TaxID=2772457 RepID=UPI001C061CB7|nr:ribosome biogenesis GTPase YlqF [Pelorhabdus rhamnosifermentans]MBU2701229.1 ribosome biogenesis GTPase A [Pelorhabdus rhamnosifermentans]